jgi:molybdate transport system substrate-binding protein
MRSLAVAAVLVAACSSGKSGAKTVRIAAAADLTKAFGEVGKEFAAQTGVTPEISFAASGMLGKQIAQGAPYYLFAVKSGKCDAATVRSYARGHVVVWTPNGVDAPKTLADLADARFAKITIANPETAPYGKAAKQALERAGVWDRIADRVVLSENVQATMLYARNGNAQAALVSQSLASVTEGGSYLGVDLSLYDPLDQSLVLCNTHDGAEAAAAKRFADYLASKEGREVMKRYGFSVPDEVSVTGSAAP